MFEGQRDRVDSFSETFSHGAGDYRRELTNKATISWVFVTFGESHLEALDFPDNMA
jgi:hypothetical protein